MFRRKSKEDVSQPVVVHRTSQSEQRQHDHIKQSSKDIHDPILSAIHDAQPFEISTQGTTVSLSPQDRFRDVFGNVITNPDRSNPCRPRDERPLDTIRSFEYSYTGDDRLRDEMETPRLGWTTRREFQAMPQFQDNPYAAAQPTNNVISLSSESGLGQTDNSYSRPLPEPEKKKKRGLFGRKK